MVGPSPTQSALGFELDRAWRVSDGVALRPEPFGALAYHFGTRRLSLLEEPGAAGGGAVVGRAPDRARSVSGGGVAEAELPRYERALATLAQSGMICEGGGT